MPSIKTLSLFAAAASVVLAAPTPADDTNALVERQWWGGKGHWGRPVWVTETATVTAWGYAPTDTPAASPTPAPAPAAAPAPAPAPAAAPAGPPAGAPAGNWGASSSAAPSAAPVAPSSGGSGYMAIVSKWRAAGGLPALTQDSTMEANALKTSTDSVGGLKHELNPGTFAQVLAPGTPSNFESVYVGGWLCEIPSLPGLNGICGTEAQGWSHDGETGHADILTSTSYTKIGCAISDATSVWACDLS